MGRPTKLTPKQEKFVAEYLLCLNATQAAIRAGYSKKGAEVQGSNLLRNIKVAKAIEEVRIKAEKRTELSLDKVIEALGKVAFQDHRKMFRENGELIPITEMDDDIAAILAGFEVVTVSKGEGAVDHVAKIKTNDRMRALELLGKYFGAFVEKHEHTGKDGGPIETKELTDVEAARRLAFMLRKGVEE